MSYQFILWFLVLPTLFAHRSNRKRGREAEYSSDEDIQEFKASRIETRVTIWEQPSLMQKLAYKLMIPAMADLPEHPDFRVFSGMNFEQSEKGKISSLLYLKHILRLSLARSPIHDQLQSIFYDEIVTVVCEQSDLFSEHREKFGFDNVFPYFGYRAMFLDFIKQERVDKIVRFITCMGSDLDVIDVFASGEVPDEKNMNTVLTGLAKYFQNHVEDFTKVVKSISSESIAVLLPASLSSKEFLFTLAGNEEITWDQEAVEIFLCHFRRLCQLDLTNFPEIETFGPKLEAILAEIQSQMYTRDLEELELEIADTLFIINERFMSSSPASTAAATGLNYPEFQSELDLARLHGKKYLTLVSNLPYKPSAAFKSFLVKDKKLCEFLGKRAVPWIKEHFQDSEMLLRLDTNLFVAFYGGDSGTLPEFLSPQRRSRIISFSLPLPTAGQLVDAFMKPFLETATAEQFQVFLDQISQCDLLSLRQNLLKAEMPFEKRLTFFIMLVQKFPNALHCRLTSVFIQTFVEISDPQLLVDLISNNFTFQMLNGTGGLRVLLREYTNTLLKIVNNDELYDKLIANIHRFNILFPFALRNELFKARSPLEFERIYALKNLTRDYELFPQAFWAHARTVSFVKSPAGVYDKSLYMMSFMQAWLTIDMQECAEGIPRDLQVVSGWFERFLEKLADNEQKQLLLELIPNLNAKRRMALAIVWYKLHRENQMRFFPFESSRFF